MGKKRGASSGLVQAKCQQSVRRKIGKSRQSFAGVSALATQQSKLQFECGRKMEEDGEEQRDESLNEMSYDMHTSRSMEAPELEWMKMGLEDVGGLSKHMSTLREIVLFPLLYPAFFESFRVKASRGVLLCGPPGTGKTLVARALASEARRVANVSFYMRKGADILSKWVGEAERQLIELFDTAQKSQPSIIFFDEVDGLAPARCSFQEHVQNSIVSTLLALMDGLKSRGQVVIIAATNRVDAIDSALRRPGRFDRELLFSLPDSKARCEILDIHTRKWKRPPSQALVAEVGAACVGYCGADLQALCTEAAIEAFKRRYPEAYTITSSTAYDQLHIHQDVNSLIVGRSDFLQAMSHISPSVLRGSIVAPVRPLSSSSSTSVVAPCLQRHMDMLADVINVLFPVSEKGRSSGNSFSAFGGSIQVEQEGITTLANHRPRLLICGAKGTGVEHVTSATLHRLEMYPVFDIGFPALLSDLSAKTAEEKLIETFREARRNSPAIVYLPQLDVWWKLAHSWLKGVLSILLQELPLDIPVLFLGTCMVTFNDLDGEAVSMFDGHVYTVGLPREADRDIFFLKLLETGLSAVYKTDGSRKGEPVDIKSHDKSSTPREQGTGCFKISLRKLCERLISDKYYKSLQGTVNWSIDNTGNLGQHPVDVESLLHRVDKGHYSKLSAFLRDLQLVLTNVKAQQGADEETVAMLKKVCVAVAFDIVTSVEKHLVFEVGERASSKNAAKDAELPEVQLHRQNQCASPSPKTCGNAMAPLHYDENVLNRIKKRFVKHTKGYNISQLQQVYATVIHTIKLHRIETQTRSLMASLEKYAKGLKCEKQG